MGRRRERRIGHSPHWGGVNVGCATQRQDLLLAEDLVAGYVQEVDILDGISLTVREGEIVTVVGPNGAGKSTLIRTIFGLLRPRAGRVA